MKLKKAVKKLEKIEESLSDLIELSGAVDPVARTLLIAAQENVIGAKDKLHSLATQKPPEKKSRTQGKAAEEVPTGVSEASKPKKGLRPKAKRAARSGSGKRKPE